MEATCSLQGCISEQQLLTAVELCVVGNGSGIQYLRIGLSLFHSFWLCCCRRVPTDSTYSRFWFRTGTWEQAVSDSPFPNTIHVDRVTLSEGSHQSCHSGCNPINPQAFLVVWNPILGGWFDFLKCILNALSIIGSAAVVILRRFSQELSYDLGSRVPTVCKYRPKIYLCF